MRVQRVLCLRAALILGNLIVIGAALADDDRPAPTADETAEVFGLTRIWKVHVHLTADAWKEMQPAQNGFPGFGGPPSGPGGPPPGPRPGNAPPPGGPPRPPAQFRPGSFGYEFEYVKADVEFDGQTYKDVGLRFKGNGTYMMSASGHRRSFKIDFDRYIDGRRFHGLQQVNLHNNIMDPTRVRQALSYPVFTAAGIPSPRTAFAEVLLTIDGETEQEFVGLYTLVEEVDKAFLRRHFKNDKGLLMKPEGTQGLQFMGEEWSDYDWFNAKTKPTKAQTQQVIDAVRLIDKGSDEEFRQRIGDYLDVDEFTRFLAVNTLLANMDSFLSQVHNYYVHLPTETNRMVLLPWDLDLSMGAFFMAGSAEQLQDLSISHPHMGQNKLIERILAIDEFDALYRKHLQELTKSQFGPDGAVTKALSEVRAAIQDLVAREKEAEAEAAKNRPPAAPGFPFGGGNPFAAGPPLETFLAKRVESIESQLAHRSQGHTPAMGFGPPPGPGGRPGRFGAAMFWSKPLKNAVDSDHNDRLTLAELETLPARLFAITDQEPAESLTEDAFAEKMGALFPRPPAPNAGGGAPAPPPPAQIAKFVFGPVFQKANADKDETITPAEVTAALTSVFAEVDADKSDDLDDDELSKAFDLVFPPPGGPRPATSN
jgi:spore coat protein CotH